jgi:glycosyltransferase involved in cell wall biosynthesis
VSRYIFDLCTALRQRGHQCAVAGEHGAWRRLFEGADWPWLELPLKGGPVALWRSYRALRRYLAEHPVDLIHTHYRRPALVARQLARRLGVPVLFTLHLTDVPLRGMHRWLTDFGDHTHVVSDDARQWVLREGRVPPERITTIVHGVDPARFPLATPADRPAARHELGLEQDAVVAAFVGRLDHPKNEGWLLDLAAAARQRLPQLRVVLQGEGPHEAGLRQRIAREGLAPVVQLLPFGDPLPLYRAMDALLLPSEREGFPLTVAEAMSVGRPVLRTRAAGTKEAIIEGVTGRSTPIDRAQFLAAALEFLADRDGLARMGAAAAEHARTHLSFTRQVEATISLYRDLATRAKDPQPEGR